MFNKDFYPTPSGIIEKMLEGENLEGKNVLEPSAGRGDIVNALKLHGAAEVLACEIDENLQKIIRTKCKLLASDFISVKSEDISHVSHIVMNPPFSADEKHILHAYEIAPLGCRIIALCNLSTVENRYSSDRKRLGQLIEEHGSFQNLGDCFSTADRQTGVKVALVRLHKTGNSYETEFEGFFLEDEPEDQSNGMIKYDFIRDLVNRYVGALKLYDQQLEYAVKMEELVRPFPALDSSDRDRYSDHGATPTMEVKPEHKPIARNQFKKKLQKAGWKLIFEKMNMEKYATQGLREDINKFVEHQTQIPFTMKNIYRMLEIVIGTTSQRMDKALEEVFDKVTRHYDENRYNVEGWKTNSHYLLTKRFIMPCLTKVGYSGEVDTNYSSNFQLVEDLLKALCYVTGDNYDTFRSLYKTISYRYVLKNKAGEIVEEERNNTAIYHKKINMPDSENYEIHSSGIEWGQWFDWAYFRIRCYKKGTIHFEFKDADIWGRFNQRIAKIKGYPLYEAVRTKETAKREAATAPNYRPTVLHEVKLKTPTA